MQSKIEKQTSGTLKKIWQAYSPFFAIPLGICAYIFFLLTSYDYNHSGNAVGFIYLFVRILSLVQN